MADMMTFPNTVEEFMEQYKLVDTEEIYTNGAELVPIFRMRQWFEHVSATDTISRQAAGGDQINKQAVELLDLFTKLYCRDRSITDDLAFRCEQCEFEMPDGRCLVKVMARKLCPDYKNFGAMGDL